MTLIRSVHALVYTGSEDGAGTDGDVYVGACGREFRLNTAENDFERGSRYTYRFGTFPTVADPELNDPQRQLLRLEDVGRLPLYIRFAPRERSDRWKLQRAIVAFNSEETPLWDSAVNAPNGIWLGTNAGMILHLPRLIEGRLRDPGELAEIATQLFAEEPPPEAPPHADDRIESRAKLVESLAAYIDPVEAPPEEDDAGSPQPVSAKEALERLKAREGGQELLGLSTNLGKPNIWDQIAYLSACERTGSAGSVTVFGQADILADHSITVWPTRAWPPTARVRCGFTAPSDGLYLCAVVLRTWDPHGTVVECLIDSRSFGQTWLTAHKQTFSFLSRLGAGWHSFTVRELHVDFRFFNLTIFQIPIVVEN